jgi:hypothetical protein
MRTVTKRTSLVVLALLLAWSVSPQAQEFHSRAIVRPHVHGGVPYYYDPFWGPYYPWVGDSYMGYPYAVYPYDSHPTTDVKVKVTPKDADVYVDGYYAGRAGTLEGILKRLHATPGGHAITVHLEGYRTITEHVYLAPGSTYTLHEAMEKLAAGETSAPVPVPQHKG